MSCLEVLAYGSKWSDPKIGGLKIRGNTGHSAASAEKDLMKLAKNMPITEFLRIVRKLTKDP